MRRHVAGMVLLVALLAASVQVPALTCQIRRFGHARPTCMCRENGRWRAWPMIACQLTQSRGM